MTDYARYHVDECCLAFDLSIRGKVEERYHRECFLNRDKGSPIDFEIVYKGENGELDAEIRKKLVCDTVMEEARVLDGLPNNYTKAWKELLKMERYLPSRTVPQDNDHRKDYREYN